jgi:hypothetical protein
MDESFFYILVLFLPLIFGMILMYRGNKNDLFMKIRAKYSSKEAIKNIKFNEEYVLFWNDRVKKDYLSGLAVSSNKHGLIIKGGFMYFWIKEIFIPWGDLHASKKVRFGLVKKQSYFLESLDIYIAVSSKHSRCHFAN